MSDQPHSKDIRWLQRFDNFKRAYARLTFSFTQFVGNAGCLSRLESAD